MLVEDHLRPAAVKAKVLIEGNKVRFGFHNLRHSLATFLNNENVNAKTIQSILRHADVKTTLGIYTHANEAAKLAGQALFFEVESVGTTPPSSILLRLASGSR